MKPQAAATVWFITGGVISFSALDMIGMGALTLLPAVCVAVLLAAFRVPVVSISLVGAGTVMAFLWGLHIASPDSPDNEVWPVLVGLGLVALGLILFRKRGSPVEPRSL